MDNMSRLLDGVEYPKDIRRFSIDELNQLAAEIREEVISVVSEVGGHFASTLGAVELTLALHYVFNTPEDRIVWDTGHQAYAHKLICGRRNRLATIRQLNGLSGFLSREESEYDVFGAGHAGTSISAALGMVEAKDLEGASRKVVAVISDGGLKRRFDLRRVKFRRSPRPRSDRGAERQRAFHRPPSGCGVFVFEQAVHQRSRRALAKKSLELAAQSTERRESQTCGAQDARLFLELGHARDFFSKAWAFNTSGPSMATT